MALRLLIATPGEVHFDGAVRSVQVPGREGSFTTLPGHAPLVSLMEAGEVVFETAAGEHRSLPVAQGVVQVARNVVQVLCAAA